MCIAALGLDAGCGLGDIISILTRRPGQTLTPEECEAANGDWGRWGLLQQEGCALRTSDFGRPCAGSADREGACIADLSDAAACSEATAGQCSEFVFMFGCYCFVDQQYGNRLICFD